MIYKPNWLVKLVLFFIRTEYSLTMYDFKEGAMLRYRYKLLGRKAFLVGEEKGYPYDC